MQPNKITDGSIGGEGIFPPMDGGTGWEEEREALFNFLYQTAEPSDVGMEPAVLPDPAGSAGVLGHLVLLGRNLERAGSGITDVPVMDATTIHNHVDRKAMRKAMEKKIAQGHAEDDHEEEFTFQQSM